ncbi:hypothetical protein F511_38738 [Dorcoceras hygrometricum]|uniref:Uncharacterized protein n=1 Tax=Dorcoceras hygrometricum TaxID=472368 RepID=A0A2Z6ZR54_9LAMI|nr:hypothetical protein F511_47410 [Dorcoceras hygrometricum]KZV54022.1 hypothetical protein F511_38738 [Dorcoceras hygrometricum]
MHDATSHRSYDVLQPPMTGAPSIGPPGPSGPSQTSNDPSHDRTRENDSREENARSRPSVAPLATPTQDLAQPWHLSHLFFT